MDLGLAVVVLVFAIRGAFRGAVWQTLSIVGLLLGLWAALSVSQWVGHHWHGARPAVVFWALRWLVAMLAGFAIAALFEWWGQMLALAIHAGPAAWIDRTGGVALGGLLGLALASVGLVALLTIPGTDAFEDSMREGRLARPLLHAGRRACERGEGLYPGSIWLARRYDAAIGRIAPEPRS
jgi:uncharacterized membrane protein required for colicin V production